MTEMKNLPELLAPAGSTESLRAALAAGADAVYFGGAAFSNRMRAKNFADGEIRDAIKLCHSVGAAAHITVNTRVRDRELDAVLDFAETILGGPDDSRADALIVADLGIAREIKKAFPHAVLHASTQTSMHSLSDCDALKSLGFSRLVVPRELSLDEIRSLASLSPIEIEMFIHGAHCVSCSGQCLMSYVMGGRSGNRGECAQPCRLPYKVTDGERPVGGSYPLSMADMYLGGHITEIISSGVASLKIEGRLKSPTYVYGVTSIYRRLLDERRNAKPEEKRALEDLFTRGFTDGYLTTRYASMGGIKSTDNGGAPVPQKEISRQLDERQKAHRAAEKSESAAAGVPLKARFVLRSNVPAELSLSLGDVTGSALGDVPQQSSGSPITAESAAKNLVKLGGSGFSLSPDDIEFSLDGGLWMPLSAINDLRRRALADLTGRLVDDNTEKEEAANAAVARTPVRYAKVGKAKRVPIYTAEIADYGRFSQGGDMAAFAEHFARIYVPISSVGSAAADMGAGKICAVLPMYTPDDNALGEMLKCAAAAGVTRVMCHTVGQARAAIGAGLTADASFRTNVTNTGAALVYAGLGCSSVTLSPELTIPQARDIAALCPCGVGLIGYGRLPLMLLSRCIISGGSCRKGNIGGRFIGGSRAEAKAHSCSATITDRMGESFPVIAQPDCTNVIYNSAVTWMGDRLSELSLGSLADFVHFSFTTESVGEAIGVMQAYASGERRVGRRI